MSAVASARASTSTERERGATASADTGASGRTEVSVERGRARSTEQVARTEVGPRTEVRGPKRKAKGGNVRDVLCEHTTSFIDPICTALYVCARPLHRRRVASGGRGSTPLCLHNARTSPMTHGLRADIHVHVHTFARPDLLSEPLLLSSRAQPRTTRTHRTHAYTSTRSHVLPHSVDRSSA